MLPTTYQRPDTLVNAGVGAFDTFFDTFAPSKLPVEYQTRITRNRRKSLNSNSLPA